MSLINFYNLNLSNPIIDAKFGAMYRLFFDAIRDNGWEVIYSDNSTSLKGDVLVVPMGGGQDYKSVQAMRRFAGPIVLYVPPAINWFDRYLLNRVKRRIAFAYGTDSSGLSESMYNKVGIKYHYLPFASDPEIMKPLHLPYQYDIVFVGSFEHASRRSLFMKPLIKALGKRPFLCVGTGGQEYGIPFQIIAWGPLLNIVYNLGKVCVNIHTETQVSGKNICLDLNNRVFDLAMAGCCQVCDNPEGIMQCFSSVEIAAAHEPEEWVDLVMHMLNQPKDAESYRQNAFKRAKQDHTWRKRAFDFVQMINKSDMNNFQGGIGDIKPHFGLLCGEIKRNTKRKLRPLKHFLS